MPYYSTHPHPTAPGRWLVVHGTVGGQLSADEDCPSLLAAEKAAAWLEAERSGPMQPTPHANHAAHDGHA